MIGSAIIRNPRFLLLDEATSALDSRSEREVQAALDRLVTDGHGQQTTLIVAHRLSTIANVDRVIVMRKGRIVEMGSPRELQARGTHYLCRNRPARARMCVGPAAVIGW